MNPTFKYLSTIVLKIMVVPIILTTIIWILGSYVFINTLPVIITQSILITICVLPFCIQYVIPIQRTKYIHNMLNKWLYMDNMINDLFEPSITNFKEIPTYNELHNIAKKSVFYDGKDDIKIHLERLSLLYLICVLKKKGVQVDNKCNLVYDTYKDEVLFIKLYNNMKV